MIVLKFKGCRFLPIKFMSVFLFVGISMLSANSVKADVNQHKPDKITLPNGWSLSPAGQQIPLGDLPLNLVISPDRKYAAVTNNGESRQSIQLINLQKQKLLDTYEIGKSWLGLTFGADGKNLYGGCFR